MAGRSRNAASNRARLDGGELARVERAQAALDLERADERLLDGDLLVEAEADEQRQRVARHQRVRLRDRPSSPSVGPSVVPWAQPSAIGRDTGRPVARERDDPDATLAPCPGWAACSPPPRRRPPPNTVVIPDDIVGSAGRRGRAAADHRRRGAAQPHRDPPPRRRARRGGPAVLAAPRGRPEGRDRRVRSATG